MPTPSNSKPHRPNPSQRTLRAILSTIRHLHRPRPHTPQHHTLPHLAQPRTRLHQTAIHTLRIFSPAPQDLPRRTSPRPDHIVQIDRVGLLAPHVDFAAEDQVGGIGRDGGEGVVGVYETPVLGRGAVVGEGVVCPERGRVEVEEMAFAAVEVLKREREKRFSKGDF